MPGGRPSEYSLELANRICDLLAQGQSMRTVCKNDWCPSGSTLFRWMHENPEFEKLYARAKEECADAFAEEMADIADDATNDWMAKNDPDNPGFQLNGEHVQRSRLRIDTRKWLASKLKPKKYGERVDLNHKGNVTTTVKIVKFSENYEPDEPLDGS